MDSSTVFRDYFEAELGQLRAQAADFGRDYPAAAKALALSGGRSADPQVELLLQSFAYLTGRLRHQLDQDATLLPNALMAQLYPHLEAPIPSLAIAQLTVGGAIDPQAGNQLLRGRECYAQTQDQQGRNLRCRMSTCFDTALLPVTILDIKQVSPTAYDELSEDRSVNAVISVRLKATGLDPLGSLGLTRLRFCINSEHRHAWPFYDLLALQLAGVATVPAGGQQLCRQDASSLRWLGFDDDEAALATDMVTHPGYRLVQEYFAFPEKFLFFELDALSLEGQHDEFELLLLLQGPVDKKLSLDKALLKLNCVPVVNLFPQRLEPLSLDQSHFEYKLSGDHANHRFLEIYKILSLQAMRPDEPPRSVVPYFSVDGMGQLEEQQYFYTTRRVDSPLRRVPGTELYVSFIDLAFSAQKPNNETLTGRALCTNRRLAEHLRVGDRLFLEGPGPVKQINVASKPTPHQPPVLLGSQPWALVSQLLLNHLSLTNDRYGPSALKSMLRLHLGHASLMGTKQIDAITRLQIAPMVRPITQEGRRVMMEGLHITLTLDRKHFEGASPVLFAEVLRRFFALYASVNTLTELSLETHDTKGKLKTWPPMVGSQIVL
ncbi:MAG: type VI secretion system baseplate subunit TssF [Pseudomonadota bacterium]|uniref:type VI secretion system baseplate subunit TssF n=1 Tax=Gallaecimonas pentaromativorans TaxID=584787 RepID=UPI00067E86C7|nr:type VI secretion system baseplate subunit TssF [Gallaecimonas pentaromativorans]MED5523362.1 type VI secretion system baseplate subunit TssF [Pseudomonadota bacterium]